MDHPKTPPAHTESLVNPFEASPSLQTRARYVPESTCLASLAEQLNASVITSARKLPRETKQRRYSTGLSWLTAQRVRYRFTALDFRKATHWSYSSRIYP